MRCPYCGADGTQVKDSRPTEDGASIRRRRVCLICGGRFTTFERVQLRELVVIKRNNRREPFEREKLQRSVEIALRKRPVGEERIERMVSGIVRQLESGGENEVRAEAIGNLVMEALKTVDDVAYVRFASVYKNFREARDFEAFVGELARTVGRPRTTGAAEPDEGDPGDGPTASAPPARRRSGGEQMALLDEDSLAPSEPRGVVLGRSAAPGAPDVAPAPGRTDARGGRRGAGDPPVAGAAGGEGPTGTGKEP